MIRDKNDIISRNIAFLNSENYSKQDIEYINKLEKYAIYCKEDEQYFWKRSCRSLINTRKDLNYKQKMYESKVFESTALLLKKLSEEKSWDEIHKYIVDNGLLQGKLIEDVSEMLLNYSPYGLDFIDEEVRRLYYVKDLPKIKTRYNTLKQKEKNKILIKK